VAGVFDEAQLGAWPDFRQSSYPIPGHVSVVLCGHNYDQLWVYRDIVVFHVSKLVHYPTHELESLGVLPRLLRKYFAGFNARWTVKCFPWWVSL